jgi:hypothetical protein
MRLNRRRIAPAVAEGEALAAVAAVVALVAVGVEDAQAGVVAVDAKAEAEAVATIIKAMRVSPESHAGSIARPAKKRPLQDSLPTMKN